MIFKQKPQPRNLSNPKAIGLSVMENHLEPPSDEDFKKAETMIEEFLKPSSADLPHIVEMAGQITSRPAKDVPPSKDASHSEATAKPSSLTPKGSL